MDFFKIKDYPDELFTPFYARKTYQKLRTKIKRIAFHKPYAGLGDLVLNIPALRALKGMFPDAELVYMGSYPSPSCDILFKSIPFIDSFIPDYEPPKKQLLKKTLSFAKKHFREFDLIVSERTKFQPTFRLRATCSRWFASRSPLFSSWRVLDPKFYLVKDIHVACKAMAPIRLLGEDRISYNPQISFANGTFVASDDLLKKWTGPFISILPSSGNLHRNWETHKYAAVADKLSKAGYTVILLGREQEREVLLDVARDMTTDPVIPILNDHKFGQDPIHSVGILKRSSMAISNDGGGTHLSSLAGCPAITFYGPSDPSKWGPLGERNIVLYKDMPCSPCRYVHAKKEETCPVGRKCLSELTVEQALKSAEKILKKDLMRTH
jgi:ADP-heptose:LPS heptosyltransferase